MAALRTSIKPHGPHPSHQLRRRVRQQTRRSKPYEPTMPRPCVSAEGVSSDIDGHELKLLRHIIEDVHRGQLGATTCRLAARRRTRQLAAKRRLPSRRWAPRATPIGQPDSADEGSPHHPGDVTNDRRTVFLVHGRDITVRDSLIALLKAFDLRVVKWRDAAAQTGSGTPYTGDIVAAGINMADAVVVLLAAKPRPRSGRRACSLPMTSATSGRRSACSMTSRTS
jgi:hypothetical protein